MGQRAQEMLTDNSKRVEALKQLADVATQLEQAELAGEAVSETNDPKGLQAKLADLQLLFKILYWLSPEKFRATIERETEVSSSLLI